MLRLRWHRPMWFHLCLGPVEIRIAFLLSIHRCCIMLCDGSVGRDTCLLVHEQMSDISPAAAATASGGGNGGGGDAATVAVAAASAAAAVAAAPGDDDDADACSDLLKLVLMLLLVLCGL